MNKKIVGGLFLVVSITNASQPDPFELFIDQAFMATPVDERIVQGLQFIRDTLLQLEQEVLIQEKLQTINSILSTYKTTTAQIPIADTLYQEALQTFRGHLKQIKIEEYLQKERLNKPYSIAPQVTYSELFFRQF